MRLRSSSSAARRAGLSPEKRFFWRCSWWVGSIGRTDGEKELPSEMRTLARLRGFTRSGLRPVFSRISSAAVWVETKSTKLFWTRNSQKVSSERRARAETEEKFSPLERQKRASVARWRSSTREVKTIVGGREASSSSLDTTEHQS